MNTAARPPALGPSARQSLRSVRDTSTRILRHPANRGRRGRALALYVAWQLWQRTVRRPWTIRLGERTRLRLHPHSVVAAFVLYYRVHDYEDLSFVRAYLRPGDLFVDVGANVGVYSLWASETEGAEVVALEPSSAAYARALENVGLNGLGDRVHVVRKAVGAEPREVRITTGRDALNRVTAGEVVESEAVLQTTLDVELSGQVPAMIKIDVEGREIDVLTGGRQIILRHQPALIIEVNEPERLAEVLDKLGYTMWSYDPERRRLVPAAPRPGENVLALADVAAARARVEDPMSTVPAGAPAARTWLPSRWRVLMTQRLPLLPRDVSRLARARSTLRERGVGEVAARAVDEVRARFELRAQRRRPPVTFVVDGVEQTQLVHLHNRTWRNERAVEIPLAEAFLAHTDGPVLELGNVLANYGRTGHVVIDKYEERAGVLNIDVVDYETPQRFGAIVALSTLEHIGWDEDVKDPAKIPKAVQHLRCLLAPTGRMLVTCPLSYNPHLDALIRTGALGVEREAFLVRGTGRWRQVDQAAAFSEARMGPHGGTAVWVAELGP